MRNREEEALQCRLVAFFFKSVKDALIYSNKNENTQGGTKGAYLGKIYKNMGRFAGVLDLSIIGKFNAKIAYVEVKTPKAYNKKDHNLSKAQKEFIQNYLIPYKIPYKVVCHEEGLKDFLEELGFIKVKD